MVATSVSHFIKPIYALEHASWNIVHYMNVLENDLACEKIEQEYEWEYRMSW